MSFYEIVFLIRPDVSLPQVQALSQQYKALVEDGGGKHLREEYWGLRALAYKIKKKKKAHYVLIQIQCTNTGLEALNKKMSFDEDLLRFLTLRIRKPSTEPSIQSQGWSSSRTWNDDQKPYNPEETPDQNTGTPKTFKTDTPASLPKQSS